MPDCVSTSTCAPTDPLIAWHEAAAAAGATVVHLDWNKFGPRHARWLYTPRSGGEVAIETRATTGAPGDHDLQLHMAWSLRTFGCSVGVGSAQWKVNNHTVSIGAYTNNFSKLHEHIDNLLNHLRWFKVPAQPEWWLYRALTNTPVSKKPWRKALHKIQPNPTWPRTPNTLPEYRAPA
jgi:hypothetical protein